MKTFDHQNQGFKKWHNQWMQTKGASIGKVEYDEKENGPSATSVEKVVTEGLKYQTHGQYWEAVPQEFSQEPLMCTKVGNQTIIMNQEGQGWVMQGGLTQSFKGCNEAIEASVIIKNARSSSMDPVAGRGDWQSKSAVELRKMETGFNSKTKDPQEAWEQWMDTPEADKLMSQEHAFNRQKIKFLGASALSQEKTQQPACDEFSQWMKKEIKRTTPQVIDHQSTACLNLDGINGKLRVAVPLNEQGEYDDQRPCIVIKQKGEGFAVPQIFYHLDAMMQSCMDDMNPQWKSLIQNKMDQDLGSVQKGLSHIQQKVRQTQESVTPSRKQEFKV